MNSGLNVARNIALAEAFGADTTVETELSVYNVRQVHLRDGRPRTARGHPRARREDGWGVPGADGAALFHPQQPHADERGRRAPAALDDDISDIHQTAKEAAEVFQSGGGMGYAFWRLRPYGDSVGSTGGIASGPITFMRTFDQMCETIAQGRPHGAQMGVMQVFHPP